jgi:hypothetical protein
VVYTSQQWQGQGNYVDRSYEDRNYTDSKYAERGYAERSYTDSKYAERGYAERSYTDPNYADYAEQPMGLPVLLDPALLRAARQIYRTYYEVHPDQQQRPYGVAIDRYTYRGKLIFRSKVILLPQEYFVPFSQLEAEIY